VKALNNNGNLQNFATALNATIGLILNLKGLPLPTVFAPTDEAFEKEKTGEQQINPD
jgi:uncharacterized surface protein with fasciclin (FAS1) repeats